MIKSWQLFLESSSYEEEVAAICKQYRIKNWTLNSNGLVDVDGDVDLTVRDLIKLPLKFGKVAGDFYCYNNNLTTLEGCPSEVGGNFDCSYNRLTSLLGCPNEVNGRFNCSNNKLTSLEYCPKEVGGTFYCTSNKLISLEGFISANDLLAKNNPVSNLTTIGRTMISKKISFPEAVIIHLKEIPDNQLILIMDTITPQKILDLNDFRIFNFLRTNFPQKYAEVCALRNIDVESDLGELGF